MAEKREGENRWGREIRLLRGVERGPPLGGEDLRPLVGLGIVVLAAMIVLVTLILGRGTQVPAATEDAPAATAPTVAPAPKEQQWTSA